MIPFELSVKVELSSDLHISGVGRTAVLIDRCIERDAQGRPYIPSTSFKGRVRAHYERLLSALGYDLGDCKPPAPGGMCNDVNNLCPACALFGSPVQQSRVEFTALTPDATAEPTTRIGVGVNRKLNTVEQGRLFFYEAAPQTRVNTFTGTVRGWATETEIAQLIAAIKLITHFGGQKARGLGRVQAEVAHAWLKAGEEWNSRDPKELLRLLQEVRP
ncbi:MAG: RAMP superfamily CRISPR-associated protein [Fimbriimonadales bacterium]|nr:RAMP superfamily CRISPR-associated protein [Fimbriimonadales bacterium]